MGRYRSIIYNKIYTVKRDTQIRWECPKCKLWLLERFEDPHKCECGYTEKETDDNRAFNKETKDVSTVKEKG